MQRMELLVLCHRSPGGFRGGQGFGQLLFESKFECGISVRSNMVCLWRSEWRSSASFARTLFLALCWKVGRDLTTSFGSVMATSGRKDFLTFAVSVWEES